MYLVFDTETNGKLKDFNASYKDVDKFPRITQIAFQVYDEDKELDFYYSSIIKPDGWEIPNEKFFIENNMSTERCEKEGVPILEALFTLLNALARCDYVIAHNISFDFPIVCAELYRLGLSSSKKTKKNLYYEE